jgi:hypothetical protein
MLGDSRGRSVQKPLHWNTYRILYSSTRVKMRCLSIEFSVEPIVCIDVLELLTTTRSTGPQHHQRRLVIATANERPVRTE